MNRRSKYDENDGDIIRQRAGRVTYEFNKLLWNNLGRGDTAEVFDPLWRCVFEQSIRSEQEFFSFAQLMDEADRRCATGSKEWFAHLTPRQIHSAILIYNPGSGIAYAGSKDTLTSQERYDTRRFSGHPVVRDRPINALKQGHTRIRPIQTRRLLPH